MRNMTRRACLSALCLFALAGATAVYAEESKQGDDKPVTLLHSLKAKDTVQYKSSLKLSFGMEVVLEQNRKYTVKEIKDNEDAVIIVTDLGGKVNVNGSDMPLPASPPITMTQNKQGKLLTYKLEMENPILSESTLFLMALVDRVIFPDKAVKASDTWTTEIENPQVKGKKVTIKTTYVGTEKLESMTVWKIKQTMEADTDGGGKLTSEATLLLDTTNGQIIESEQSVKGIPTSMGSLEWKGKVKRVMPDAEKKSANL